MNQLGALLWAKARMSGHWVASVRRESRLKVAFVSLSAAVLWFGAFLFTSGLLRLFDHFGESMFGDTGDVRFADVLLNRLLSTIALTLLVLLVVSNVLVSFATVYRSKEVAYLIQAPISVPTFFVGRFIESLTFSSWALAFLGAPVLLAYGLHRDAALGFYVALALFFLPFVAIPAALGSMITVILVRVFSGLRRGAVIATALLAIIFVIVAVRSRIADPALTQTETFQAIADTLGRTQSPFLPSHWLAEGLLRAAVGEVGTAAFYWLLLVANALLLAWLATVVAELFFYRGWSALHASDELRGPRRDRGGPLRLVDPLLRPLPQPLRSLVAKDIKLFWRDPAQWTQFLIFFGIMALYTANIRNTGGLFSQEPFRSWIAILNMAATMLILATLTTRFIYPLISLEGRRFWILSLSPLTASTLVWQKFWLSVVTTSFFTVGLALISGIRLELEAFELALTLFGIVATTFALSGLAVGLGGLYPNFEEDNPSRITSGMGGTLNFILSLAFIVTVTTAQAFAVIWRRSDQIGDGARWWVIGSVLATVAVLALVTTWVPLRLGMRNLARVEV